MTSPIPGLVIFLNNQINATELQTFQTQLFINQTMSLADFNNSVSLDGYFVNTIHGSHTRILVLLDDFTDQTNRNLADLILYVVKSGMVSVLDNITGYPKGEMDFNSMTVYDLLKLKNPPSHFNCLCKCNNCCFNHHCCGNNTGISDCQRIPINPVYIPNCDNENNNTAWKNRKP